MPIFPVKKTVMMRYADTTGSITSTTGAVASYVLRANDCFDPDFTGTGHQPMGFDQMILFYNHFFVVRSRLKVTFRNYNNLYPYSICIRVDANSGVMTVPNRIVEFGGAVLAEIGSGAAQSTTLELDVDIAKFLGMTRKVLLANTSASGDAGTSPAEGVFFHIQVWDNSANTTVTKCDFVMEQEVVFTEPRDLTESLRSRLPVEKKEDTVLVMTVPKCSCKE